MNQRDIQISKIKEEGIKEDGNNLGKNVLDVEEIMSQRIVLSVRETATIVVKKVILPFTVQRRLGNQQLRVSNVNENRSRINHKRLQDKSFP